MEVRRMMEPVWLKAYFALTAIGDLEIIELRRSTRRRSGDLALPQL